MYEEEKRRTNALLFRFFSKLLVPYVYVIFDLDRAAALKTVNGYLDDIGGAYCGRYGDMRTDESSKSRELAAEKALNMQPSRAAVSK